MGNKSCYKFWLGRRRENNLYGILLKKRLNTLLGNTFSKNQTLLRFVDAFMGA